MVAIEKLSGIFPKVAANMHQSLDPPQKQPVTKSDPIPHKVRPTRAKPIPSEMPNIIEDDDGNSPTDFQQNLHISPSGPYIIIPDVPVPPPMVSLVQPPRVDTGSPSSSLRSSCKKNPVPNFALAEQFLQVRDANAVTHQISGVDQKHRHLVKGPDKKSFVNELGKLSQGIRTVKGTNTVIFVSKTQVPKDKKVTYGKIVCELES